MRNSQSSPFPRAFPFKKAPRQGLSFLAFSVALALSGEVVGQAITSTTTGTPTTIALTNANETTQIVGNTANSFGAITLGVDAIALTVNNAAGSIDINATTTLRISDTDGTLSTLTVSANASGAAIDVANDATLNLALGIAAAGSDSANAVSLVIADDIVTTGTSSVINFTTSASGTDTITFTGASIDLGDGADDSTNSRLTLNASADSVTFSGSVVQAFTGDIDGASGGMGSVTVNNTNTGAAAVTFNDEVGRGEGTALNAVTLTDGAVRFNDEVWTRGLTITTAAPVTLGSGGNLNLVNTGAVTVGAGTISGVASGNGTLNVVGGSNAVTFGGVIGGTNALGRVNIGDTQTNGTTNTATPGRAGTAVFSANVTAQSGINVVGGDAAGEVSSATFSASVSGPLNLTGGGNATADAQVNVGGNLTGVTTLDEGTGGDNGAVLTFNGTAAQTVSGDIMVTTANTGEGTVVVNNTGAGVTFNDEVGTTGGQALRLVTLTDGAVRFNDEVWTRGLTITTAASVALGSGGNLNLVNTGAVTVGAGTINGAAAGNGTLNVVGESNTVTFAGVIGGTNALGRVNIGDTQTNGTTNTATPGRAGTAVFSANVTAQSGINVVGGDAAGEVSSATFSASVSGPLNLTGGGNATADAQVNVGGNLTGVTTLDEGTGGDNGAVLTFNGTAAQTVSGDIMVTTANTGEGTVVVNNTGAGVTFNDEVGTTGGQALRLVTLTDGAVRFNDEVWTRGLTITTAASVALGSGGNLNLVNTGAVTVGAGTINGAAAGNGTLNVVGESNAVTFGGVIGGTNALGRVNIGDTQTNGTTNTATPGRAGTAVFSANVTAQSGINVVGGDAAGEVSSATFSASVSGPLNLTGGGNATADAQVNVGGNLTGVTTLDEGTGGDNGAVLTFNGTAAQTVSGDIMVTTANTGEGTVVVNNTGAGVTFNDEVGTTGGQALRLVTLTDGAVRFNDEVWTRGLTITTAAPVTLGSGGNLNLVNTGAVTVGAGTISGVASGNGTLNVVGGSNAVTFGGVIGGTNALGRVNIGDTQTNGTTNTATPGRAGTAVFSANVTAQSGINVVGGDAAGEVSSATFSASVSGPLNLTGGGNATADAQVNVGGNLTGVTTLDEGTGGDNGAVLTFNGTAAQTVSGDIMVTTANTGEGTVVVNNTGAGVTFNDEVGTTGGQALRLVTLTDGAVRFNDEVWTRGLTITTAASVALGSGGNLNLVNTGAVTVGAGTINGAAAGNGTLNVVGESNTVTFAGVIGGTNALGRVNIGDTQTNGTTNTATPGRAGTAVFSANVTAQSGINVVGGDAAGEVSSATFSASVSGPLNLTGGGNATADAQVNVGGNLTGVTTLDEGTGGDNGAVLTFNGTGSQTVAGDIDGESAGEGAVVVNNTGAGVSFNDEVGTSGTSALRLVTLTDGAVRFNDDAWTQDLTVATAAPVTLGSGGNLNLVNTGAINTGTGTIDGAGNSEGIVNVLGGSNMVTFGGVIGGASMLSQINVGDPTTVSATRGGNAVFMADISATNITVTSYSGAASSATFMGNVTTATSTLTLSGNSTVMFGGSGSQTITGVITATGSNQGTVMVNNTGGVVTFNGALGSGSLPLGQVMMAAGTNTVLTQGGTVGRLEVQGGTVTMNAGVRGSSGGVVNLGNGSTLRVGSGFPLGETVIQTPGELTDTGTVNVELEGLFFGGDRVVLIDAGSGTPSATYTVSDTVLVDYEVQTNAEDVTVSVEANFQPSGTVATNLGTTLQAATGLGQAGLALATTERTGTAAAMFAQAMLTGGETARQVAEELTVQPEALEATGAVSAEIGSSVTGVTLQRLGSLRTGRQYAGRSGTGGYGFSAGDSLGGESSVWFKPFGNLIDKRNDGGIPGYSSRTGGIVAGWERGVSEEMNTGVALAYAETEVDGDGAGNVQVETDQYQALVYGDYTQEDLYIEGSLSVGRNRNETRRTLASVGAGTARGDFNGWQYNATVQMGWPRVWKDSTYFTPLGGVSWTQVNSASYTETGATSAGLNMRISPDNVTALVGTLGAKLHTEYPSAGGGQITPSLELGVNYDLAGDEATATAQYTGGGGSVHHHGG